MLWHTQQCNSKYNILISNIQTIIIQVIALGLYDRIYSNTDDSNSWACQKRDIIAIHYTHSSAEVSQLAVSGNIVADAIVSKVHAIKEK